MRQMNKLLRHRKDWDVHRLYNSLEPLERRRSISLFPLSPAVQLRCQAWLILWCGRPQSDWCRWTVTVCVHGNHSALNAKASSPWSNLWSEPFIGLQCQEHQKQGSSLMDCPTTHCLNTRVSPKVSLTQNRTSQKRLKAPSNPRIRGDIDDKQSTKKKSICENSECKKNKQHPRAHHIHLQLSPPSPIQTHTQATRGHHSSRNH